MSRPRGFIDDWVPQAKTLKLINQVQEILEDNSDILPLTLRQIFYMLVSNYGFEKTERDYKRLCENMNKARRARMISMNVIRDDGLTRSEPFSWGSEDDLIDSFKGWSQDFKLDRQTNQSQRTMVWCEAGGMLPQLVRYCEDYGVGVLSSGGFDSVTTKHNFALSVANQSMPVEILHIGDHDPSGVHMCSSLDEDLTAFVDAFGGDITVTRLAVVPHQIEEMGLAQSPPKTTDRRSFSGLTTQAEAIPPRTLREIVTAAVLERIDDDIYQDILNQELEIRESLAERLEHL